MQIAPFLSRHYVVICDLSYCNNFSILYHKRHDFQGGGGVFEKEMYFDFLNNFCLNHFLF
jgi:hypothetical protein